MTDTSNYTPREGFIQNLTDRPRQFPAMYHFAGTGPSGETCAGCASFLVASNKNRGRCVRWIDHRGLAEQLAERNENPDWWRGLPCISAATAACKYFAVKSAPALAEAAE